MRTEKKSMVNELAGLLDGRSAVLFSYQGLTANVFNSFRAKVAGEGINGCCHVVPNKLLKKAAAQVGLDALANVELSGDTAMVSGVDAVSLVRAVKDFAAAEGKDKVKIKMSCVEGQLLNAADTLALANLPSKEAMQAQLLGLLQAPAAGIVRVINAKVASILYVLNAYKAKLEETA